MAFKCRRWECFLKSSFFYAVSREPADKWTNDKVELGLRLAIELRWAVISYRWV